MKTLLKDRNISSFYLLMLLVIIGHLSLFVCISQGQDLNSSTGDLHFEKLPERWDEGFPLGNGMLGALVWEREKQLRFSLDRADLWDLREVSELKELTFDWVYQQVKKGEYGPVQRLGDDPYNQYPYPTKIQAAGLNFKTDDLGSVEDARLYVKSAELQITWSEGASLNTFVHAEKPIGWFRFENVPEDFRPILDVPSYTSSNTKNESAGDQQSHSLADLGYDLGKVEKTDSSYVYTQYGWNEMHYKLSVRWKNIDGTCLGVWSITSGYPYQPVKEILSNSDIEDSEIVTDLAFDRSYIVDRNSNNKWWRDFWSQSQVLVPDTLLQKQYERDMYKFAASSRPGAPPISLQAVWTADNGSIPPWKGDFHHNLNTQLSYWPGYQGNHLSLTRSFTDWLWNIRKENKEYTQWYFESEGLNVPGVTTLTGQPMGGWIQYSMSPTISAWLAQHFYWQWIYSQDDKFLINRAYPYLKEVMTHLEEVTLLKNGVRTLPLSSSPEIHDNSIDAWYLETTNYDLALMKNAFRMAAELASELGKTEMKHHWEDRLNEFPSFSIDETGLLVAPDNPLKNSHRHFSHLMAIHPLGLIDPHNGEDHQKLIDQSLKHLAEIGTDAWVGYSFSWLANLHARAGNGEKARDALQIFATNFVSPNSFHLNGDQKGGQYSNFTYRPFTLEGNFAFASGLQEMLMQSNTGIIEIFPAIPDTWADVSFTKLRAQGAFLVSAERNEGKITQVKISSEKGKQLQLANPFYPQMVEIWSKKPGGEFQKIDGHWENGILQISTTVNENIKLLPVSK